LHRTIILLWRNSIFETGAFKIERQPTGRSLKCGNKPFEYVRMIRNTLI
jgi:hypothetical protein